MFAHYIVSHFLTVITALASTLMVIRLLGTRRTPQSLIAWALALMFLPLAAIPLYFLIGTRKFPGTAKRAKVSPPDPSNEGDLPPPGPVARVLHALGAPPARRGHGFELLPTGEVAYARLLDLITRAERSIELTIFILGDDSTGHSIVEALAARAKAGVRVRVVVDAIGSARIKGRAARSLQAAGGSLRAFMPLMHAPLRGRNNLRCHRKVGVFDGERVFLGGMNIAEEYMGPTPKAGRWRDVAAIVTGSIAGDATALFESDWAFCGGSKQESSSPPSATPISANEGIVQFVPSGPDMVHDTFYDAALTAISSATQRIVIVTPYYVPDDVVQHALVLAARRGVRTELVVPAHSNHGMADFARRGLLRGLTEAGALIHFFPHGMLHAKAMVTDDTFAFLGSPNMDMRSFFLNYEDALCLYSAPQIAEIRAWAEKLIAECTDEPPVARREYWLFEQIARMLAPEL